MHGIHRNSEYCKFPYELHPCALTWHWKSPFSSIFNRKYIFKWWLFHCPVSFRVGTALNHPNWFYWFQEVLQLITSRKPIHRRFFGRDSVEASCSCNGKFPPFLWEKHISASPMFGFLLHDGYGWWVTLQEIEGSKYPSEFRTGGLHRLQLAVVGRDKSIASKIRRSGVEFLQPVSAPEKQAKQNLLLDTQCVPSGSIGWPWPTARPSSLSRLPWRVSWRPGHAYTTASI